MTCLEQPVSLWSGAAPAEAGSDRGFAWKAGQHHQRRTRVDGRSDFECTEYARYSHEITLPAAEKGIELTYSLQKDATLRKEAAYFAFPFAGDHPEFGYESQNGWIDPARDELIGGSREWYAVNHWAAMTSDGATAAVIPWMRPSSPSETSFAERGRLISIPGAALFFPGSCRTTGIPTMRRRRVETIVFRYRIVSTKEFDAQQLTRLGWEAMTPLESDQVGPSPTPHALHGASASFLHLSADSVVATTWKLAEDGDGSILRLEETAGRAETVAVDSSYLRLSRVWLCNVLEEKSKELPVAADGIHLTIPAYGVVTLRFETQPVHETKAE